MPPTPPSPPLTPEEIAAVRRPFRAARLLPARAYHDESVWAFEREQWFFREWLCVARVEEASAPGDFMLVDVLGESVVIVRGRDGALRAFHNVCRHRGTAIVEDRHGRVVRLQCPYHAWVYDLDGRLVRAQHTEDLEDFSVEAFGLVPVRCETWGGFAFLCFDEATPPLRDYLGDWVEHHDALGRDFTGLGRAARLEYEVAANWKIVAENYSECYHCPPVHPLLNRLTPYDLGEDYAPSGPWKGGWMPFAKGCETMSMDGLRHGRPILYARDEAEAQRIYYYLLWPNLIVSVHPDYVLTHHVWPLDAGRTAITCDLYVDAGAAGTLDVADAVAFWDLTNRQDYHVVELQQRGIRSRSWVAGRYSNQEASVHAFDLMAADRYAMDGRRTQRGVRTPIGRARPARADRQAGVTSGRVPQGPAARAGDPTARRA